MQITDDSMERGLKPHLPSAHLGTGSRPSPRGGRPLREFRAGGHFQPGSQANQRSTSCPDHTDSSDSAVAEGRPSGAVCLSFLHVDPRVNPHQGTEGKPTFRQKHGGSSNAGGETALT